MAKTATAPRENKPAETPVVPPTDQPPMTSDAPPAAGSLATEIVETVSGPAAVQPSSYNRLKGYVGMAVLVWEADGAGGLRPIPGWLIESEKFGGGWTVNVMRPGILSQRRNVNGSAEPAERCWTPND
jgi:hypothetical protein